MFAFTATYTMVFHYQVPFYDHWDIVYYYEAAQSGKLSFGDLFLQHGSHWHATGYVIMLATASLTDMAHWPDPLIGLLLAAFGFVALLNIVRRAMNDFGAERYLWLAIAITAFIHFSPDQAENLLWGWQVALFACMAATLWSIDLLSRPGLTLLRTLIASIAAAIAIYGFATAWALLPVGIVLIAIAPHTSLKIRLASLALWTGTFAALLYHFLLPSTGYPGPAPSDVPLPETVAGLLHYVANFLGSALARITRPGAPLVAAFGALLFLILIGITLKRGWKSLLAARGLLALAAFTFGAALLTALGRWAEFGAEQAFSNRYTSIANNAWLALVILGLCLSARWSGALKTAAIAGLCLFGAAKILNNASAISIARLAIKVNASAAALACSYPEVPAETRALISTETQDLDGHLAKLKARQASLFRPEATRHCDAGRVSATKSPG